MKNGRDTLAGIVAEFWCIPWLKMIYGPRFLHEFGGLYDRGAKIDYTTEEHGPDYLLDVKASIDHPNILIEVNHPAFETTNMSRGHRGFVLPFRDFPEILVVRSTSWFKKLLEERGQKKTFGSREVYLVTRDLICRSYHSPNDVRTIDTEESFGSFFNRNFPGGVNPIAGMSSEEIKAYANTTIKNLCLNDDIPDDV